MLPYLCILVLLVSLSGCQSEDQIERYQVARAGAPHRMLGAIVPRGERGWFFKLTGANEVVAKEADNFTAFIESIQFGEGDDADPTWKLPEGWTQEPGKEMRFATIRIATDEQSLELTVIPLPMPPADGLLANINRWRGQLGLAPVDDAGLANESTTVKLGDNTATLVNLVGKSGSGAPMPPPFAGATGGDVDAARRAAHSAAGVPETAGDGLPAASPSTITYEAPEGWEPEPRDARSMVPVEAAFVVKDGDHSAKITVTALGPGAGDIRQNVNRWRGQIELEPFSDEQLAAETNLLDMNGVEGKYFALIGPEQAILGVIATQGNKVWFVKLLGESDLAVKLQDPFEKFVRSIKFLE